MLLISFVFVVLSCYVSLCSEFRVAHFVSFYRVVLLCVFMFRVAHFFRFLLCCPVMYLYILSSVLLISLVFLCCSVMCLYVLSSVLLISFVLLCCPVMCLYALNSVLLISLVFVVLSCYVSVCS